MGKAKRHFSKKGTNPFIVSSRLNHLAYACSSQILTKLFVCLEGDGEGGIEGGQIPPFGRGAKGSEKKRRNLLNPPTRGRGPIR